MRKLVLMAMILCLSAVPATAQFVWLRLADAPVPGAPGQAFAGAGEALYLARDDGETTAFWRFAPDDGWAERGTRGLPETAFGPGAALAWDGAEALYALGGEGTNGALYRYDLGRDRWSRLADTPAPQGAANALAWNASGEVLYALLGGTGQDVGLLQYDPPRNRWDPLPLPDSWNCAGPGAGLASLGRFGLYALRGACDGADGDFARFDPFRRQWTELPPLPGEAGAGGALLWHPERPAFVHALVGQGRAIYRYVLDNRFWERLPDLPCPVGAFAGNRLAFLDGALHVWQGAPVDFRCGGDALLALTQP